MKKEVKIPLYASIDGDVYEVIGVNNVEEIVKVKNFKSGDSFTMPINKWIIESFKLGTPTTFDYKGNKISGEIIMKNGVKSISLYPDENYGGAIQRIIPLNLIDVTTSSSLMNKELFKDGGNISSENQEKIEKLQKVVNSNLIPENIKEKARLEIEALKSKSESKIASKINPTYIKEITTRTGTNPVAVEKFFNDNNLGDNEALGLVTGLGRKQIEPLDFVAAITGKDGNQYAINIVWFLKNKESFKSQEESKTVGEIDSEQRQLNKKVYALLDKKLSGKADIGFKLRIVQVIGAALEDANYHSANYDFAKAIDSSITTKEEWYRSKIANPSKEDGNLGREISNLCGWDGEKIVACFDFALKMFGMSKIADVLNKVMTADEEEQEDDEDTITNTYKGLIYNISKDMYEDGTHSYSVSVFEPKTNYHLKYSPSYNSNLEAISGAKKYIDSIKINGFYPKALIPTVSITDRNGTFKLPFNTVSDAKEFTLAMISHGFEYTGKPIEEESVKSEPKSDVSTVEIKDSRIGDKNISEISTYIPNREILSVKVKHNGKEIEIKGTDIFDGIYVDDKIIPSTRKPKAEPKMSRTQFEEETFEFEKGGRVLNDYVYKEVFDYIIGGDRPSSIEIVKKQVNDKAKEIGVPVSEIYKDLIEIRESNEDYHYMEKGGKVISKELEKIIDTTRSFFESNGVNYGQIHDLDTEFTIEPSTVLPKNSNLPKGSLDGMQILYDKTTKIYEVSEYQAGPDGKDLYIFGEYKSLIPALKSLIKGNSTTGRKPIKIEKFEKGGKIRKSGNVNKIQKQVDEINAMIAEAIDNDGDAIPVIDLTGTWEEPVVYLPIKYTNGTLYIKYYEIYNSKDIKKETVRKSDMEFDNPLPMIARMYRKALKNYKNQKNEMFAKGGYVRPAYNMPIVGNYSFKTKDGLGYEFRVTGFERAGDDTDSLYFDDSETTAKKELGTIIIKNSSWKNLANGKTIMAVSEKGVSGKLTKIK